MQIQPLQQSREAFVAQLSEPAPPAAVMRIQSRVLEAIARGYSLDEVLNELCFLIEAARAEGLCSILILNDKERALHPGVGPSLPPGALRDLDGLPAADNSGSCGTAAFTGCMAIVEDTSTDPRWAAEPLQQFAQGFGVKACWSSPFFNKEGETLGTFAISLTKQATPSQVDLELLQTAAHLASIAVERARMEEELKAAHAKLRSVLGPDKGSEAREADENVASAMRKLAEVRTILARLPQ